MTARSMDHHPTTPICTSAGPGDCSISNPPPHHTPGDRQGPRRVHDRRLARPRLDGPAVGLRPQLGLHPLQGPGAQPHEPVVSKRASGRWFIHRPRVYTYRPFGCPVLTTTSYAHKTIRRWFEQTKDLVPNHILAVPHPNACIGKKYVVVPARRPPSW